MFPRLWATIVPIFFAGRRGSILESRGVPSRWNDQWFRQHANQEFRFQQLALDVDRAGYAVEMLMEWQEEKGSEMPAVLVDRLTTGLFTDQTTEARVRHPTEDVTSALLKASSGVPPPRAWRRRGNRHGPRFS